MIARATTTTVRVAIYTRKSVDKGNGGEFGSIEAQREAVEGYITSQREQGWVPLPTTYDDLGESGANTRRPAFQRLLTAIEAGLVDLVAVYRLDRLSRSQRDFLELMDFLEQHGVTFVSVTERFDTTTPMGRFALGISIQVAQLERETTALRVRDKVIASRRKGMWTGGVPLLGYDSFDSKLIVNEPEAARVRETFRLYLDLGSLRETAAELSRRGLVTKSWTTKAGKLRVGTAFTKNSLATILRSPLYVGKIHAEGELHTGQHEAIVDEATWTAVQTQLAAHRHPLRPPSKTDALLQGVLRCGVCGAAMGPHTTRRHERVYVSYVCQTVQKQGARACPGSRAAAHEIDGFVVQQIQALGSDPDLQRATVEAAKGARKTRLAELRDQAKDAKADAHRLTAERTALSSHHGPGVAQRLADIDAAHQRASESLQAAQSETQALSGATLRKADLRAALEAFVPVWDVLFPTERRRVIRLLIERVVYDAKAGELTIDYRPGGIRTLAQEAEA
ncbi:MAG: recombinase family protein [Planctomycetota bacterium]|nr:MAG: recombinase family protein [Planctomycetota bacterium]